jgi:uncharacterized membrane protein
MGEQRRGVRELRRLERLMDVVFALAIWRIFTILPRPDPDQPEWDTVLEMLTSEWGRFVTPIISILILVVFWLQNNDLFSRLRATDSLHAGLAVFQLFFVLFLLYAIGVGIVGGSAPDTRVLESVAAALVGVFAYLAWRYAATKRRLVAEGITDAEIHATSQRNLAEPLTALLTIPFAFVGPVAWELSWFLYPLLRRWFRRSSGRAS